MVMSTNCRLLIPPPIRRNTVGVLPNAAPCDMLSEQLFCCDPVKHWEYLGKVLVLHGALTEYFCPFRATQSRRVTVMEQ